jgi:hypothetical protein
MFGGIVAYPTEEIEKKQDGFAKPSKSEVRQLPITLAGP